MDMAAVLGIPARAISLNGRLGLAFGARGKGGIGAAAAHYEPDTVVINLTKGGGPGSLAHEWWHALDNYFAKEGGGAGFMTADARGDALRDEMRDAFLRIRKDIQSTAMRERSRQLDKRRSKDYWSTHEELSARAFESYIIAKLQDQNASNDYLANVVSQKAWDVLEGVRDFGEDDRQPSYPYPTVDELPTIRAAFDEFFRTVETRETDQGVAMFSRSEPLVALSGDEIGQDISPDNVVRLARDYYKGNLQNGEPAHRPELGKDIEFTGKGWNEVRYGLKHDLLRAKLIPAIRSIIERGEYRNVSTCFGPLYFRLTLI